MSCAALPDLVTSNLYIGGSLIDRGYYRLTLQRVSFGISGYESLDFCQEVVGAAGGDFPLYENVTLEIGGVVVFRGQTTSITYTNIGRGVISVGYHCMGSKWVTNNQIFTTAPDGSGQWILNRPESDPLWIRTQSALSVGKILEYYFDQHSDQLSAIGILPPPLGDLDPLTVVPVDQVILSGNILDMAETLLQNWGYNKYQLFIDPGPNQIRILDTTALPSYSLELDYDPIELPQVTMDISNCFTRMVCRGGPQVTAGIFSLVTGTLVENWTSAQEDAWTYSEFTNPSNSFTASIATMTSQVVTIQDPVDVYGNAITSFAVNEWSQAQITVQYGFGPSSGATYQTTDSREVLTNTVLNSSNQADFTVDVGFAATLYQSVEVRGVNQNPVWRSYIIPDSVQRSDGSPVNQHLLNYLQSSIPFNTTDGAVVQATGPTAEIYFSKTCTAPYESWYGTIQIVPSEPPDVINGNVGVPGSILFDRPTVEPFSSVSSMNAGTPDGKPCDIKALVPFAMAPLQAIKPGPTPPPGTIPPPPPPPTYEGTAYTDYGLDRTWYRDYFNWTSLGQAQNMYQLAQNYLDTVKNTVVRGTLIYHGVPMSFMTPGASLMVTWADGELPYFQDPISVRTVTVEWPDFGGSYQVTQLHFDNQRRPWTGSESLFLHPLARRMPQVFDPGGLVGGGVKYGPADVNVVGGPAAISQGLQQQADRMRGDLEAQTAKTQQLGLSQAAQSDPTDDAQRTIAAMQDQARAAGAPEQPDASDFRMDMGRPEDYRRQRRRRKPAPLVGPKMPEHIRRQRARKDREEKGERARKDRREKRRDMLHRKAVRRQAARDLTNPQQQRSVRDYLSGSQPPDQYDEAARYEQAGREYLAGNQPQDQYEQEAARYEQAGREYLAGSQPPGQYDEEGERNERAKRDYLSGNQLPNE